MPWDVNYASAVNAANTGFANQQLGFGQRRVLADQEFGMGAYADAATNPYSRAALLRQSYDQSVKGSRNAAGRNYFSGSYELAQRGNEANYAQNSDQLGRDYRNALADISQQENDARTRREEQIEGAGWKRLEAAANEPPEPEAVNNAVKKRRQKHKGGGKKGK